MGSPVKVFAVGLLLLWLTGCGSPPHEIQVVTPMPSGSTVTSAPEPKVFVPSPAIIPAPIQIPQTTPPTVSTSEMLRWVAWESWCEEHGLGRPQRSMRNAQLEYMSKSRAGTLEITAHSAIAHWNGTEFYLGFAPKLVEGKPYVTSLDVEKTLSPLLLALSKPARPPAVIVIDPGHGGNANMGATSVFENKHEKDYTLDWALRLRRILMADGFKVFLTRTNDVEVKSGDRVALADHVKGDLFVSLHFNSVSNAVSPQGLETYCFTPTGLPSNLTRGYSDDVSSVSPNNGFDLQNFYYAFTIHQSMLDVIHMPDRGVRRARFVTVLQGQRRPALLVEGGYLSNMTEARRIAAPEYRQRLAEAVAAGILKSQGR